MMWTKQQRNNFDATVWKGPLNLTTATVRLSMLVGLGLLWLALGAWIYSSI